MIAPVLRAVGVWRATQLTKIRKNLHPKTPGKTAPSHFCCAPEVSGAQHAPSIRRCYVYENQRRSRPIDRHAQLTFRAPPPATPQRVRSGSKTVETTSIQGRFRVEIISLWRRFGSVFRPPKISIPLETTSYA